jgi:uncharacterized membrane protein
MRGEVLGFDPDSNTGAISGHDGRRYDFVTMEWRGAGRPRRGDMVDFVADGIRAREVYPLAAAFSPDDASTANIVYILYLVSLITGITSIIGVIIAYVNRSEAPDWVQTHYRFQIRTFWIGLLYGLIGLVLCLVLIGFLFLAFVLIWFVVRCVKGMGAISRGQPYDNPATWLW